NRPDVVVKSLHWGPWAGGMVTAELKAAFAQRGIVVIERDDGAAAFVAELSTAAGPDLEVVLGAGLADDGSAVKATPTAGTTGSTKVVMSAATMPWMRDHAVKGEVVLPVVVATDLMARLAGVTSLHKVEVIKGQRLPRFEGEGHVAEITI